ncbi:MAG TPA: DUF924 family protein [Steroidobacteraceae bacterium]|nr:DUF924 family protein [Steroidobacteraceae bacterium]
MTRPKDVLDFWFGTGPWNAARLDERYPLWFGRENDTPEDVAARDALIRTRLEPLLERAAHGEFNAWAASPKRRLALILLFDQVPRNCYRGTAAAFAFDREALALSLEGLQLAADAALDPVERVFFYLPLEHAESLEAQDAGIAAFGRLAAEAPPEVRDFCVNCGRYAQKHRDIIEKFGRFPHRNRALGRADTEAEKEWLAAGGASFGQ